MKYIHGHLAKIHYNVVMTEVLHRPPYHPASMEYGEFVVSKAAQLLRTNIETLAVSASPELAVEIKHSTQGAASPVTKYDRDTEDFIGRYYLGTDVHKKGEENTVLWDRQSPPALEAHTDPIDGTKLFIEYVEALVDWYQQPESDRGPRPICGSMISVGAVKPGSSVPAWGAIAAPFMSADGIVRWRAGYEDIAQRIDPDGTVYDLPKADRHQAPESGAAILVASDSTEKAFREPLEAIGLTVVKYDCAVASALSMMDPGLLNRLEPDKHDPDQKIIGVVMRTAHNWDVAGVIAMANRLGHTVTTANGRERTFEDDVRSAVFSASPAIGQVILEAIAHHIQQ